MSYSIQFYAAWLVFVVGAIAGVLAGADKLGAHPSWLTSDLVATCTLVAAVCIPLAAVLPQITRTPSAREAKYTAALAGAPPDDIARKYPTLMSSEGTAARAVSSALADRPKPDATLRP